MSVVPKPSPLSALCSFSKRAARKSTEDWTKVFSSALEETQDRLSHNVRCRDPRAFVPLLRGRAGVGGVYDLWRRAKARWRGTKFEPEHGGFEQ